MPYYNWRMLKFNILTIGEAEVAKEAWDKIGDGVASDLTLKKPQLNKQKLS